jgi:predicted nucleic acid-binding Zn ribbon protein
MQKITDDPVTSCEECGAPVQRVFHPVAVHFKGSGFYNTDYGTAKRMRETAASAESGADKHDAKQAEKKSESKPASDSKPASSSSDS